MKGAGYQRRDPISHRRYNWRRSIAAYKRSGKFKFVAAGAGHRAGEEWGDRKDIDPESPVRRYSKNSPSFDEGVYTSKQNRKAKKMMADKMSNLPKELELTNLLQ